MNTESETDPHLKSIKNKKEEEIKRKKKDGLKHPSTDPTFFFL